jgi:GTP-binding protein
VKARQFVDTVRVQVRAGRGGNGRASFRREAHVPFGGPDGGDGGRGAHVILRGDRNESSLVRLWYSPHLHAEDGGHGCNRKLHGRNGRDLVAAVPCGTEVRNEETGEILGDIVVHEQELVAARGGRGGLGNCHWKTSTHQTPTEHSDGQPGEFLTLRLDLKAIADVGLVGFPNAGKSSLLAALTDARPRIAAYPFTTLHPVVGTVMYEDYSRIAVADIPGLIRGAHDGVGLGHDFLKHIERARVLLYVLDMAGTEGRKPWEDYAVLRDELRLHRADLLRRPFAVVANKMDLAEAAALLRSFARRTRIRPLRVSAKTGAGFAELKAALPELVRERS